MMAKFAISALYWTNKVYASRCYNYFSTEKYTSEFETHQQRFDRKYAPLGYQLDELHRVRAGPDTKTVDFWQLWDMLRSKDEQALKDMSWAFED